jgi:ABC-type polysaccharide/polyol phosphate transport system ATPase subunit
MEIALENVFVDFPIYGSHRSLRKVLFDRAAGGLIRHEGRNQDRIVIKAISDVSFRLEEGDRLGLMGHNGAGKSTLLKVIAGIYEPVSGRVTVRGRITSLFDVLPGLDIEDTGYENIVTAGMLLGMKRSEIEARIPDIEEFSELGEYLSLPVRTYSAGMQMRLGFSVATAVDPGILLIDEGIGSGDARFAARAHVRLTDFMSRSRILVLASHSDKMLRSTCNKVALMQAGQVIAFGSADEICDQYEKMVASGAMVLSG